MRSSSRAKKSDESIWSWFHEDTRSGCQKLLGHPSARSPRPKPNWSADSLSLSLSPKQKEGPSNKRNQIDTFTIRVCLPIMLKPRGLGRRVAQGPHSILRQFQAKKKHIKQNESLSGPHVIVICFRLSRRIQTPFRAVSGRIRQNQAISSKIRPFSGIFRQNQAESGRIRQNQAKSGKIRQNRATHWIWKIIGQGSYTVPRTTNCSPFLGRFFLGAFHQTKAQANYNQTTSNVIILPRTWQLCGQILSIATVY